MTGNIGLVVNGPPTGGEVILTSGNNTYTGTTVVSYGTLQVGDGLTTNGSLPGGNVTDSSVLIFANPYTMTFGGVIGGNGQLAKTSARPDGSERLGDLYRADIDLDRHPAGEFPAVNVGHRAEQ